jgi:hypothetical protein
MYKILLEHEWKVLQVESSLKPTQISYYLLNLKKILWQMWPCIFISVIELHIYFIYIVYVWSEIYFQNEITHTSFECLK